MTSKIDSQILNIEQGMDKMWNYLQDMKIMTDEMGRTLNRIQDEQRKLEEKIAKRFNSSY